MKTDSFKKIYDDNYRRVYNHCNKVLKNEADADEATNKTFYKVFKSLHECKADNENKFARWINSISYRESCEMLRINKKHCDTFSIDTNKKHCDTFSIDNLSTEKGDNSYEPFEILGIIKNPRTELIKQEEIELIKKCIDKLKQEEKDALTSHLIDGNSIRTIAKNRGININAMKATIYRSKRKVVTYFSKEQDYRQGRKKSEKECSFYY
jgi:RNA polymerase sigma-70 factor (ECF subfamily)